jgi:hypothetical protein
MLEKVDKLVMITEKQKKGRSLNVQLCLRQGEVEASTQCNSTILFGKTGRRRN